MQQNLITPENLAKRWSINTQTLSQWRWNGRGPVFLKIGRRVLYRLEDVAEFEENKRYANTSYRSEKPQMEIHL